MKIGAKEGPKIIKADLQRSKIDGAARGNTGNGRAHRTRLVKLTAENSDMHTTLEKLEHMQMSKRYARCKEKHREVRARERRVTPVEESQRQRDSKVRASRYCNNFC